MKLNFILVLLFCVVIGCGKKTTTEEGETLVHINGSRITVDTFEDEFLSARGGYGSEYPVDKGTAQKLKAAYLNQMIEESLILIEGTRVGIKVGREEIDAAISGIKKDYSDDKGFEKMLIDEYIDMEKWRKKVEKKLLMDKVIYHSVSSKISIDPENIEKYYNNNMDKFKRDEQVKARQILLKEENDAASARERIEGGEDFATVAREISLSPDATDGGELGYFSQGVMPAEFDEVVFTIEVDQLSDVVRSPYGYHLFLVEERIEARELSFEEAKSEIVETLRRDMEEELYAKWMEGLKEKATIEINQEALKRSVRIK